jgi:hypothetical protein
MTVDFDSAKRAGRQAIAEKYNPRLDLQVGDVVQPSVVLNVDERETVHGVLTTVTFVAEQPLRCKRGSGDDVETVQVEVGSEVDLRISGTMLSTLWEQDPARVGDKITLRRDADDPPSKPGYSGAKNVIYIRLPAGVEMPGPIDADEVPY